MFFSRHVLLQFLFRKPFGVHSPFLYNFATQCIYTCQKDPVFKHLEEERNDLINNRRELSIEDYGAGRRKNLKKEKGAGPLMYRRRVSSIARHSLQRPTVSRMLFRMAKFLEPENILELGTSLGITTAYLAMAAPEARIITLEGCRQTAAIAEGLFKKNKIENIDLRTGAFHDTLGGALCDLGRLDLVYLDGDHSHEGVISNFKKITRYIHEDSVLILDDIRWSGEMKKAWQKIANDQKATLVVDLYKLGIVFFNPAFSKQIIPLGY